MPTPNGRQAPGVNSVSCVASTCTAVGSSRLTGLAVTTPLAERWNGSKWTVMAAANPGKANGGSISGVSCTGPSACTMVGFYNPDSIGLRRARRAFGRARLDAAGRAEPARRRLSQLGRLRDGHQLRRRSATTSTGAGHCSRSPWAGTVAGGRCGNYPPPPAPWSPPRLSSAVRRATRAPRSASTLIRAAPGCPRRPLGWVGLDASVDAGAGGCDAHVRVRRLVPGRGRVHGRGLLS